MSVAVGASCVSWRGLDPSGPIVQICELPVRFDSKAIVPGVASSTQLENCEVSFRIWSVDVTVTPSPGVSPGTGIAKFPGAVTGAKVTYVCPAPLANWPAHDGLTKTSM